jgi:hypothetical protein
MVPPFEGIPEAAAMFLIFMNGDGCWERVRDRKLALTGQSSYERDTNKKGGE